MDIAPGASEESAAVVSSYNEWLVRTFPGAVYRLEDGSFTLIRAAPDASSPVAPATPNERD